MSLKGQLNNYSQIGSVPVSEPSLVTRLTLWCLLHQLSTAVTVHLLWVTDRASAGDYTCAVFSATHVPVHRHSHGSDGGAICVCTLCAWCGVCSFIPRCTTLVQSHTESVGRLQGGGAEGAWGCKGWS